MENDFEPTVGSTVPNVDSFGARPRSEPGHGGRIAVGAEHLTYRRQIRLGAVTVLLIAVIAFFGPFLPVPPLKQLELLGLSAAGLSGWGIAIYRFGRGRAPETTAVAVMVGGLVASAALNGDPEITIPATWHGAMLAGCSLLLWAWVRDRAGRRDAEVLVLLLVALYCGIPAANDAHRLAKEGLGLG